MSVEQLAARKQLEAAANNEAVLSVLAAAGDAGVAPGRELAGLATLPGRTTSEVVSRLVTRGLARRDGKRRVYATEAGLSEAGAGTLGLSLAPALDLALACFPAEALRAFARLQLAAVPARWHLSAEHADGWAGFISLGPTSTGKTSVAKLVCRIYGLEELTAIKAAFRQTPGSLVGRRERDAGSATGWRAEPSPALELPYLCVDEWDKAPRDVQAAAGGLLMGDTADELERERVEIRPTIYATLNTGRDGLRALHEAHVRRSVVLDTTELRPLLADVDEDMARLFGGEIPIPRLSLEQIKPMPSLPGELRRLLRAELRSGLTEEGWRLTDVEALSRITLGRAALTAGALDESVFATALDYLSCAATLGHTQPGFAGRLAPKLGGHGPLVPDVAAAEAEAGHRQAFERDRRRRTVEDKLEFEWMRERAAAAALESRDAMGRTRDPDRQALARVLTSAAESIRGARSLESLRAAIQATARYDQQARVWSAARDRAAAEREQTVTVGRQSRELARRARQAERERAQIALVSQIIAPLTQTRRSLAPAELGQCPGCNRIYPTRANFGTRIEKCTACDRRLLPVR